MQSTTNMLDPSTRLALANLRAHLSAEGDFSTRAIGAIIAHVREHGTLDDAPFVRPDEVDDLTAVYVRGFGEVPDDSPEWGSPAGREHCLNPLDDVVSISFDDDDVRLCPCGRMTEVEPCRCEPALAPIAGGSLEEIPPPYEPTPEDWADYNAMMATADYLDGFNAVRPDNA